MKDWELKHAREWGYCPRICYVKALGMKCVSPRLTCNNCIYGKKVPGRFDMLKRFKQIGWIK